MAGWCSAVGWNWTNSTSATGTPARRAMATPSPVDSGGLVVTENSWPAPPVARTTWFGPHLDWLGAGGGRWQGAHPDAAATVDEQLEREPALEHRAGRAVGGVDQRTLHLGAGGGTAGVDDARRRMATLASERERPRRLAVELDAERDQFLHTSGSLVDQDAHGFLVAQPGASGERVGEVQVRRVLVAAQHCGHAPLGPARGRLGQRALGQDPEGEARAVRRDRPGQTDRGGQSGDAAAQDQDVEGSRPGRVDHAGSVRVSSASSRADASSMTRLRPSTWTTRGTNCSSSARS